MSENVKVLQLGKHNYAAEVHEGEQTTEHRVTFAQDLLDALQIPDPDEVHLVSESMKYLLQTAPAAALQHDIDLEELQRRDADFVPELQSRLGA